METRRPRVLASEQKTALRADITNAPSRGPTHRRPGVASSAPDPFGSFVTLKYKQELNPGLLAIDS